MERKNIYFASDFHLGVDLDYSSKHREKIIVDWLTSIEDDCHTLYLVGDIFDYWFEYKKVIPKGHTRLLGKLAVMCDAGVNIHFFSGNHDMWMFNYFQSELGIHFHRSHLQTNHFGKKYYISHGDGLGPGDYKYKFIKSVFANPISQWFFHRLHPNFGIGLMQYFSNKGRLNDRKVLHIDSPEKEWLAIHSENILKSGNNVDYFIYGHRHCPLKYQLKTANAIMFNLGDWMDHFSYLKVDENGPQLYYFKQNQS